MLDLVGLGDLRGLVILQQRSVVCGHFGEGAGELLAQPVGLFDAGCHEQNTLLFLVVYEIWIGYCPNSCPASTNVKRLSCVFWSEL